MSDTKHTFPPIVFIGAEPAERAAVVKEYPNNPVLYYKSGEDAIKGLGQKAAEASDSGAAFIKPLAVIIASEAVDNEPGVKKLVAALKESRTMNRHAKYIVTYAWAGKRSPQEIEATMAERKSGNITGEIETAQFDIKNCPGVDSAYDTFDDMKGFVRAVGAAIGVNTRARNTLTRI